MTGYKVQFQVGEQTPLDLYDGDDYETAYRLFDALSQVPLACTTTLTATTRPDGTESEQAGKGDTARGRHTHARQPGVPVLPPKR